MKGRSLKAQILFLCLGLSFVTLLVGGIGYLGHAQVTQSYSEVSNRVLPKTKLIDAFMIEFLQVRIRLRTLGLPDLSASEAEKAVTEARQFIASADSFDEKFEAMAFAEGEHEIHEKIHQEWLAFRAIGERVLAAQALNTEASRAEMKALFLKDCPEAAQKMMDAIDAAIRFQSNEEQILIKAAESATRYAGFLSQFFALAAVVGGLVFGFLFASRLASRIQKVTAELTRNAEGLGSASRKIAKASQDLSKSASSQTSYFQESVTAIEKVDAMISRNAENALQSQTVSGTSHEAAAREKQAVDHMIRSIEDINQSNATIMKQIEISNRQIWDIVQVIADIGAKTQVINDIVFQTKLLSFNASVEAVRAGEHGRGFAVVAQEVGNLAQVSGTAAKEISTMLESSVHKVETIVNETRSKVETLVTEGRRRVEAGTEAARRCGEILDDVVSNVSEVNQRVSAIATASQEQAQGITGITKSMSDLDKVTQQNAEASQTSAAHAHELRNQAENLREVVRELVKTVHGDEQTAPAATPSNVTSLGEFREAKRKIAS